jgi:hypothetical protein
MSIKATPVKVLYKLKRNLCAVHTWNVYRLHQGLASWSAPACANVCCPASRREARNSKGVCVKRVEKPKTKPKPAKPAPQELEAVPPPKLETPAKRLTCPPGFVPGPLGKRCIRIVPKDLTTPKLRTPVPLVCPRGKVPDESGKRCVSVREVVQTACHDAVR